MWALANPDSSNYLSHWQDSPNRSQPLDDGRGGSDDSESKVFRKIKLNSALTVLSASYDFTRVVVASREGLKVLSVAENDITEVMMLRGKQYNSKFALNDVKWGNTFSKQKIASAGTSVANGIVIWDLGGSRNIIERMIAEHDRAVNRVCFNPNQGVYLLSASQDSTMKLWDLRARNRAMRVFEGKCEAVRDVQFNSVNSVEFVAAFDNGTVQKWDMRKPDMYERRLNAHMGAALAVDWHADGHQIATGGRDKTIKIWDMYSDNKKALQTIQCTQSVARVQWRPNHSDEVTSSALLIDYRIFVWNIRRPYVATYLLDDHEDLPTGFLWKDANTLWSCGKDKYFIQRNVSAASPLVDLFSKSALGWNIYDEIAFAVDKPAESTLEEQTPRSGGHLRKMQKRLPGTIDFEELKIQQKAGVACLPTFDYEAFKFLAENYVLSSDNVAAACEHNAKAAWEVGKFRVAETWKMLQLLCGKTSTTKSGQMKLENHAVQDKSKPDGQPPSQLPTEPLPLNSTKSARPLSDRKDQQESPRTPPSSKDSGHGYTSSQDKTHESAAENDDSSSDSEDSEDQGVTTGGEATLVRRTSRIVQPQFRSAVRRAWDCGPLIEQLFEYYTEEGDVQMCVTIALVLDGRMKVSEERLEQWLFAYIELLHRFQLWTAATGVILVSKIPSIRDLNQKSTTVHTFCNNCFKPILNSRNGFWMCERCKNLLNPCSICHVTVKGLYTWCQGCSHGGHLVCIRAWFDENDVCPTGCGHRCCLTRRYYKGS